MDGGEGEIPTLVSCPSPSTEGRSCHRRERVVLVLSGRGKQ